MEVVQKKKKKKGFREEEHTEHCERYKRESSTRLDVCWVMDFPRPSTVSFQTSGLVKQLSTFAGDIIDIQDLIVSTAAGPAVRDREAQAAAAAVVHSTRVGAFRQRQTKDTDWIQQPQHTQHCF